MKFVKRILIFSFVSLFILHSNAQIKDLGLPFIVNYNKNLYKASTQNWDITQGKNGFMYFANNEGILEYDGTNWKTYEVNNRSVVRSIFSIGDTIYSGAYEEIGFLAPDFRGEFKYQTLNDLIPENYRNFGEVWNIYEQNGKIYFQSFIYIFILSNGEIEVIEPSGSFSMLHEADNSFYVVDSDKGLMTFKEDSLVFLSNHPIFFRNEIRCILPLTNGDLLIGTSNEGLFKLDKNSKSVSYWNTSINKKIIENTLYSGLKLKDGNIAFGSVSNGIYLCHENGVELQHLNRFKGLQNNTILSIMEDKHSNLWLGLDNGIDYLEVSSPISVLNFNFNIETAYASIVYNDILYVGTNQGLYAKEYSKIKNMNLNEEGFKLVKGTEGQVWSLQIVDNTLFCGHNFGCYVINNFEASRISDKRGFWSFLQPAKMDNIILAGTYTGLVRLQKKNGKWTFLDEVKGFSESCRVLYLDDNSNLWVSHGYLGLFKLSLTSTLDSVLNYRLYNSNAGLPEKLPYNIQILDNKMLVTTVNGVFQYESEKDTFMVQSEMDKIFRNHGLIDKIEKDSNGNLWYFTEDYLGLIRRLEDGSTKDIKSLFSSINESFLSSFQNIYIKDQNNIFIGSQNGLIHYSPKVIHDYSLAEKVYIKKVDFYGKKKPLITYFTGITSNNNEVNVYEIPFSNNSALFRFTTPVYENAEKLNFSFRLIGFDSNWSKWNKINFKEYTNLREGDYTFQVKAINAYGTESDIALVNFEVKPPKIRSQLAYVIYLILLLIIIAGNIFYLRRRILKIRMREKLKHEKRLAQREQIFLEQTALSEKEIIQLRNESLRNEMIHKNKELANATLHLIQKNKSLTKLKDELNHFIKSHSSENLDMHGINRLKKRINKDLKNEKNWDLFNTYFDDVHQDFIDRLKKEYSDLTPKELRLCSYLRMNISTKEIAPLMNISIRGVEISRYRLRKKLNLSHDTNLVDFILSF